jgi:hypothetical protein
MWIAAKPLRQDLAYDLRIAARICSGSAETRPKAWALQAHYHRVGGGGSVMEHVMPIDEEQHEAKAVPKSLTFSQAQVNHILGYSLAKLYQDLMKAPIPEKLQALLDEIAAATQDQQETRSAPKTDPMRQPHRRA